MIGRSAFRGWDTFPAYCNCFCQVGSQGETEKGISCAAEIEKGHTVAVKSRLPLGVSSATALS